jgi:FeS assembly SUF system regulator
MLRVSKLADYAIVLMAYMADDPDRRPLTARRLSQESDLPLPTVAKILKALSRAGLLQSHRGGYGGYSLARPRSETSVADVIAAIDGPIALTGCGSDASAPCDIGPTCPVRENWRTIARDLREVLKHLTLDRMSRPLPTRVARVAPKRPGGRGRPNTPKLILVKGNA